jgi:carbonic anhydrase
MEVGERPVCPQFPPAFFFAFQNIEQNVRQQLQKLRTHPWIPKEVSVRGFVYDVSTGRLREIK